MFPFKYQLDLLNIVKNGKFFIANKKIEITDTLLAENHAAIKIENPVGNKKDIYITHVEFYSSIPQDLKIYRNVELLNPTVINPVNAILNAGNQLTAKFSFSNEGMVSDESKLSMIKRSVADKEIKVEFPPLILKPKESLTLTGSSDKTQETIFTLYWYEE